MGMLDGKTAVVAGAGRGIGRGIAIGLAKAGAKVVVNDLGVNLSGEGADASPASGVVDTICQAGGQAISNHGSVADYKQAAAMVEQAVETWGRLDILVNVAGNLRDRMIFNINEEDWDAVINVHLKGMFAITKPAAIVFRQQRGGRVIGFTSVSGLIGNPGQVNYGAAKDGIAGFCRTVARDLGRYGITVNAVSPAADTRMTQTVSDRARELRARATQTARVQRPANNPDDVAPVVAFLCTDHAKDINGQIIYVAGGTVGIMNNPYAAKSIQKFGGPWTFEEIAQQLPVTIAKDFVNPAPPMPPQAEAAKN